MRIAVTYENGEIFQHFGRTESFKLYEVGDGKIISSEVISTNGKGHGELAAFLADKGVRLLICGGIGGGAQVALAESGIEVYGGAAGNADEAVKEYLNGSLNYNPDVRCEHHDHEHGEHKCGEGEHKCRTHGCGKHD